MSIFHKRLAPFLSFAICYFGLFEPTLSRRPHTELVEEPLCSVDRLGTRKILWYVKWITNDQKKQSVINSFYKKKKIDCDNVSSEPDDHSNITENIVVADTTCELGLPSTSTQNNLEYERDIGNYVGIPHEQVEEEECYNVLCNSWCPTENYEFTSVTSNTGSKKRYFKMHWIKEFPWLSYSHKLRCGLCRICVLFAKDEGGRSKIKLGKLVNEPLMNYKDAKEKFRSLEKKDYHKKSVEKSQNFIDIMEGRKANVVIALDSARQRRIEKNREKLLPIIKTVIFCGVQNIALRGHRDDGSILTEEDEKDNVNLGKQGNFKALLKFRTVLKNHLQSSGNRTQYISKTSQNDIIECCGEIIKTKIVNKVKVSGFYSILVDETTDIGISEQMSFCIRYFDIDKCVVQEKFIGFSKVVNLSGESLTEYILNLLKNANLDLALLRGQGYDGGSNMSGICKGVQARILNLQPFAFYTHCASHRLNLVLNKASSVPSIRNTVAIISSVSNFLRESALRTEMLTNKITELLPSQKAVKAKKICEARWVERHESILHFLEILPAVVNVLDELSLNANNSHTSSTAYSLSTSICKFEFLLSLKILTTFLALTLSLSIQLQNHGLDYSEAMDMVEIVKSTLISIREKSEDEFNITFAQCKSLAEEMNVEIKIPRVTKVQKNRPNICLSNPEDFFRVNIFLPYLDYLISELDSRFFKTGNKVIAKLQKIIPKNYFNGDVCENDKNILEAAIIYESDLPYTVEALKGELKLWKEYWMKKEEKADNAVTAYKYASLYPNIQCLLKILCVIPVTTCSSERSFSTLRRIKTYLRSSMGQDRLNGLAMLHINNEEINAEEVLDLFAKKHSRRLLLEDL